MNKMLTALLFSLIVLNSFSQASTEINLKLAATEWPPYTGENLSNGGLAAEIVTAAFNQVGYRATFVVAPWARAQMMVKEGQLDGLGIAWYTDKRAKTMAYSQPFLKTEIVLIKHKDDLERYQTPDDLEDKHFSILRGYGYTNLLPLDSIQTTVLDSLEQSLQMLVNRRIDLTIEDKLNARYHLSHLPEQTQEKIAFVPQPLKINNLHITISRSKKNHALTISDFNRGLELILQNGTYHKILNAYDTPSLAIMN